MTPQFDYMINAPKIVKKISILCLLLVFNPIQATEVSINVAIVYLDTNTAYKNLFATIIRGIEEDKRISTSYYKHGINSNPQDLSSWLEKMKPDVVVALGQASNDLISNLSLKIPVVSSAVTKPDKQHGCICLNSEPGQLFGKLVELKPDIKRIIYVHHKNNNAWLIPIASTVSKRLGINLELHPVSTLREAALQYKKILDSPLTSSDAIWLPLDSAIPGEVILPEILKSAWSKRFIIFSSNPYHVKRGGLFALFPDYHALGKQIADISTQIKDEDNQLVRISPLLTRSAINIRTARHLSLKINNRLINKHDLVFPNK